jgi:hypothetical protein
MQIVFFAIISASSGTAGTQGAGVSDGARRADGERAGLAGQLKLIST